MEAAELAKELAGNWQRFGDFAWHEQPANPERWGIVHTIARDTDDPVSISNARVMVASLRRFRSSFKEEHMGHWACGWVDGFSLRVYDSKGQPTKAFEEYARMLERIENYPVLSEDDMSEVECEQQEETLRSYYLAEVRRDLEKRYEENGMEYCALGISDEDLLGLVYAFLSEDNIGWEYHEGSGQVIAHYDEMIEELANDHAEALKPEAG